jgi:hypothetical protein
MNKDVIIIALLILVVFLLMRKKSEETENFIRFPQPTMRQIRTWDVLWRAGTGTITFMFNSANRKALSLDIRSNETVLSSYDGANWGPNVMTITQFHNNNINRNPPLRFKIIFNPASGFTINYQDINIATYINKFNIRNVMLLNPIATSGITISEQY